MNLICFVVNPDFLNIRLKMDTIRQLKKIKEINYYYDLSIDCKIWKDYEKECLKYSK